MMTMQISLSAKLVSMLDINTIVIEKGHLSHTKNQDTFQSLLSCKGYLYP